MYIDALNPWNLINAAIGLGIALVVSFGVSAVLWRDSDSGTVRALDAESGIDREQDTSAAPTFNSAEEVSRHGIRTRLVSPMTGEIIALGDVNDAVFSKGIVGQGVAIRPTDGAVRAPISGTVVTLLKSKHAVGLRSDDGVEVLVHVGLDTVQLNGAPFTARVAQGDRVEAGQLLVEADLAAIVAAGYETTTPVLVVNSAGRNVTVDATGIVTMGDAFITVTEKELSHGTA